MWISKQRYERLENELGQLRGAQVALMCDKAKLEGQFAVLKPLFEALQTENLQLLDRLALAMGVPGFSKASEPVPASSPEAVLTADEPVYTSTMDWRTEAQKIEDEAFRRSRAAQIEEFSKSRAVQIDQNAAAVKLNGKSYAAA